MLMLSCEEEPTTFRSSVPAYPVRINIDTRIGQFVHFTPTAINSHIIVNRGGYFLNGKKIAELAGTDMYGYAGVVVYINVMGIYDAYDLCCPNCVSFRQACDIDGIFAICSRCGEHYDLGSGTAVPTKGLTNEYLRRLNLRIIHYSDNAKLITITQ